MGAAPRPGPPAAWFLGDGRESSEGPPPPSDPRSPYHPDNGGLAWTQTPGETMFVPAGWRHAVINLPSSEPLTVAVTHNLLAPAALPRMWPAMRAAYPVEARRLKRALARRAAGRGWPPRPGDDAADGGAAGSRGRLPPAAAADLLARLGTGDEEEEDAASSDGEAREVVAAPRRSGAGWSSSSDDDEGAGWITLASGHRVRA